MARKIIRPVIVAALAGAALTAALPAQATQASPRVAQGTEIYVTYFSNAQETTVVGSHWYGSCGLGSTGTTSSYYMVHEYLCPG